VNSYADGIMKVDWREKERGRKATVDNMKVMSMWLGEEKAY
jgi:hypothetical protein